MKNGDAIDNISRMPDVNIKKCRTGNNRPRGFLISTPGKVIIEENEFYNSHCAIAILGDANFWYESGAVNDVVIRNNVFKDCCYASGGPVIYISPEIRQMNESLECFHKNISIENNRFDTFDTGLLYALSVDGLNFTGNRYCQTKTYEAKGNASEQVSLNGCKNARIQDVLP